jgi:hypothetical protein
MNDANSRDSPLVEAPSRQANGAGHFDPHDRFFFTQINDGYAPRPARGGRSDAVAGRLAGPNHHAWFAPEPSARVLP